MKEKRLTGGTLFTGFGGVDIGMKQAGIEPIWGIEYNAKVAEVAKHNLGNHINISSILDEDPELYQNVDVLHASPPCPNFSVANNNRLESDVDASLSSKVSDFIKTIKPKIFTLENVWGYRKSKSWKIICNTLYENNYMVDVKHVNSADFGVPQTRKRMIVRAIRDEFVPRFPEPETWIGWYETIEDLLPELPESQFSNWQIDKLPSNITSFILGNGTYSSFKYENQPMDTITANSNQIGVKAFCINNDNTSRPLTVRMENNPIFTITSSYGGHPIKSHLSCGRIVSMTPRALARFQTFPDWYELPKNKKLACYGIGNAVPPLLYEKIISQLVDYVHEDW